MKDKNGHDFRDLVAIQTVQLAVWDQRLKPAITQSVRDYVVACNRQANDDTKAHCVFRGQDLVQIILDWPELKDCYPKPAHAQSPSDFI